MDEDSHEREPVTGPAVVGRWSYLCWTPCHQDPARIDATEFEPWMATAVRCRRCGVLWTVEFPAPPPGGEPTALWRPLPRTGGDEKEEP
jgi:hypothetical protein